jgi:hypothetical protein
LQDGEVVHQRGANKYEQREMKKEKTRAEESEVPRRPRALKDWRFSETEIGVGVDLFFVANVNSPSLDLPKLAVACQTRQSHGRATGRHSGCGVDVTWLQGISVAKA